MCDPIVAGNVDRVIEDVSTELRRNLGEVISLFPLPVREAAIESVAQGRSSYVVFLRLVGETDEVEVQTRWNDRDGRPTVVEASHLSRREVAAEAAETEGAVLGADEPVRNTLPSKAQSAIAASTATTVPCRTQPATRWLASLHGGALGAF